MNRNNATYLYLVCLVVVVIASAVIAVDAFFGLSVPDTVIRICGILDFVAIPVMVFALVRSTRRNRP